MFLGVGGTGTHHDIIAGWPHAVQGCLSRSVSVKCFSCTTSLRQLQYETSKERLI